MKKIFESHNYYCEQITVKSTTLKCGWCDSIISPNKGYEVAYNLHKEANIGYLYICPNCNQIILYNYHKDYIFPLCKYGKTIKKLPEDIEMLYNEIRDCYSISAFTSIGLLGRKLLMHIAVREGANPDEKFVYYVNYLNDNGYVPKKSKHLLEFLRNQGNEASHDVIIIEKEDAEKIISFIELILIFIYEYADEE